MAAYLIEADFKTVLRDVRLTQIVEGSTTLLADVSDEAQAKITDSLDALYDTDVIFAKTGTNRDKNVLRWMKMIALYYLYSRVEDDLVPERVIKDYDDTLKTLERIEDAIINAKLPRRIDTKGETKTKFRWGSNPKREH